MKRSHWPYPNARRHSRWIDLGLAVLLGVLLAGQALHLAAPPAAAALSARAR